MPPKPLFFNHPLQRRESHHSLAETRPFHAYAQNLFEKDIYAGLCCLRSQTPLLTAAGCASRAAAVQHHPIVTAFSFLQVYCSAQCMDMTHALFGDWHFLRRSFRHVLVLLDATVLFSFPGLALHLHHTTHFANP